MSEAIEESNNDERNKTVRLGPREVSIPREWDVVPFEKAIELNPQYDKPGHGPFDYLPMDAVDEDKQTIEYWTKRDKDSCTNTWFKKRDTVYAKITPCTENGKIAFVDDLDTEVGSGSTEFLVFHPRDGVTDERFVYYLSNLPEFRSVTISLMEGSTGRQRVPSDVFKAGIEVPLPTLPEQRRIVEILSTVDERIRQTDEIVSRTKELKRGLMQNLFTKGLNDSMSTEVRLGSKIRKVPQHWNIVRLSEISDIKRGASPRPIGDEKYFGGDVGWIRISDITQTEHKYVTEPSEYLSELGVSESVLIEPETLLLSISATIGEPAILKSKGCIHDGIVALRKLKENVDIEYLYYALLDLQPRIQAQNQRAAGHQTNVNSKVVRQSEIPLPPLEEQKKIADILGTVDRKLEIEENESETLESLKRGLIQDLLTGKVRTPQDRLD